MVGTHQSPTYLYGILRLLRGALGRGPVEGFMLMLVPALPVVVPLVLPERSLVTFVLVSVVVATYSRGSVSPQQASNHTASRRGGGRKGERGVGFGC